MTRLLWIAFLILHLLALPSRAVEGNDSLSWLSESAANNRYAIEYDGQTFSGAGWETLVGQGREARFFMIGEEHGIAENPPLIAQLFRELAPSGYRRLLIEISSPMAHILDEAAGDGGMNGLKELYAQPGSEPAFFGMVEEMEMLAAIRAAVPKEEAAFWGADYEVAGDRALIRRLQTFDKPLAAEAALNRLAGAASEGWAKHAETGKPQYIFTFAGDPELVRDVERAWPERSDQATLVLDALEETLVINSLWTSGKPYESNVRRAGFIRESFLQHWDAVEAGARPRVMAKFGANHMVRGRNMTNTYDLGTLMPEIAARSGESTVSLMVLPGRSSPTAVLDASTWTYEPAPPKDGYQKGLEPIFEALLPDAFTLIDLRALRADTWKRARSLDEELLRVVFGFDFLLVMSGSTAASDFDPE